MDETGNMAEKTTIAPSVRVVFPYLMWFSATLLYGYQFFLRASPTVLAQQLMQAFKIDATDLGILVSFYYMAYAALQIPIGVLIDKIGLRRVLSVSALICALGTLQFASADTLIEVKLGRLLMGCGSAGVFLSCIKLITLWFPRKQFGIFLGFTMMMGTLGAINAGAPLAFLNQSLGWRQSLMVIAMVGLVLGGILWGVIRDRACPLSNSRAVEKISLWSGLRLVLTNKQILLASFYGFTFYAVLSSFSDLWGTTYIMRAYGLERPAAAAITSTIYIGVAFGGPFFGFVSERLQSRKIPMMIAAAGSLLLFCAVLYGPEYSVTVVSLLLFSLGFCVGGKLMNFAVATDTVPYSVSATATGVINTCAMASGVVFQPLIGNLMGLNWNGVTEHGIARYTTENYVLGLSAITAAIGLAFITTFFMKESYPKD